MSSGQKAGDSGGQAGGERGHAWGAGRPLLAKAVAAQRRPEVVLTRHKIRCLSEYPKPQGSV